MKPIVTDIGMLLKLLRTKQRRTQADVAHTAGTTAGYLSHVECGRYRPGRDLIRRLFTALGIFGD